MKAEVQALVCWDPNKSEFVLYVDEFNPTNQSSRTLTRDGMVDSSRGRNSGSAGIRLNQKSVQRIMDNLWAHGIRPQQVGDPV